jgi:hypothetical protein
MASPERNPRRGDRGQVTTAVRHVIDVIKLTQWIMNEKGLAEIVHPTSAFRLSCFDRCSTIWLWSIQSNLQTPCHFWRDRKNDAACVAQETSNCALTPQRTRCIASIAFSQQWRTTTSVILPVRSQSPRCTPIAPMRPSWGQNFISWSLSRVESTDPSLPGMTPSQRQEAYSDVVRVLRNLHSVDFDEVGLSTYGKTGHYVERNIQRLMAVSRKQSELRPGTRIGCNCLAAITSCF